jgi:hypothetical protein
MANSGQARTGAVHDFIMQGGDSDRPKFWGLTRGAWALILWISIPILVVGIGVIAHSFRASPMASCLREYGLAVQNGTGNDGRRRLFVEAAPIAPGPLVLGQFSDPSRVVDGRVVPGTNWVAPASAETFANRPELYEIISACQIRHPNWTP